MSNPDTGTPTDEDQFAADLTRTIRTLMQMRGISVTQMRERMHLPRQTWYSRTNDGNWTARQMANLATVLDVEIADLYMKPEELIRSRCFAPLALVSGESDFVGYDDCGPETAPSVVRPTLSVVPQ